MTDPMQRAPAGNRGSRSHQRAAERQAQSNTLDLFSVPPTPELDAGKRLRDDGMRTAENNSHPGASAAIDRIISELVAERVEWTADTVRERGGAPLASSSHLMGARINAAARRGEIVCVGVTTSTRPERRQGLTRIWRAAP